MARRRHPVRSWIMHLFFLLIVFTVLCGGIALGALCLAEGNPPRVSPDSQAVVVLGCQVYADGRPSPQLELRLEAALQTYREHPRLIIVCGAQGEGEPAPEGQVMREWLIQRGVPEGDALAECESRNTRENLQNAKALLPEGVKNVTVVTSDYHLPRALALARDLGLTADGIGSPCKPEFWVKNHSRELLAWGKYLMEKVTK